MLRSSSKACDGRVTVCFVFTMWSALGLDER